MDEGGAQAPSPARAEPQGNAIGKIRWDSLMQQRKSYFSSRVRLLGLLSACVLCSLAGTQATAQQVPTPATESALAAQANGQSAAEWRSRHGLYFKRNWGVEIIGVKPVSSGFMLAFKYRVVDPDMARTLNERKIKAHLIDEATGTVLAVPALENIGELRQGTAPEADRTYFMVFGNPGKLVKSGSRVSIVAGDFRLDGLVVD